MRKLLIALAAALAIAAATTPVANADGECGGGLCGSPTQAAASVVGFLAAAPCNRRVNATSIAQPTERFENRRSRFRVI